MCTENNIEENSSIGKSLITNCKINKNSQSIKKSKYNRFLWFFR